MKDRTFYPLLIVLMLGALLLLFPLDCSGSDVGPPGVQGQHGQVVVTVPQPPQIVIQQPPPVQLTLVRRGWLFPRYIIRPLRFRTYHPPVIFIR